MASGNTLPSYDDDDDVPTANGLPSGRAASPVASAPAGPDDSAARPKSVSVVRLKVSVPDEATAACLASLAEHQLRLTESLRWGRAVLAELPRDVSTRAAGATVGARLADATAVRDALNELNRAIYEHLEAIGFEIVSPQSPLVAMLQAVHGWLWTVLYELVALIDELHRLEADWTAFRERLNRAKAWLPRARVDEVRDFIALCDDLPARMELNGAFDELVFALCLLEGNLEHRFG